MITMHHEIIEHILNNLFEPDERRLKAVLADLIQKNNELQAQFGEGIMYEGTWYPHPVTGSSRKSPRILIHESMKFQMDEFARQELTLKDDRLRLRQGLHQVLKPCKDMQDIRDALPEPLMNIPFLAKLAQLPRLRPEGYTLLGSERGQRQFNEVVEKLKFYSVAGLFY